MHQATNGKLAFFFSSFLLERYDRLTDPKKYKSGHNLSEKKGESSVCLHMRFKNEVKFSDRNSQN